jgi:hypothetical protein
MEDIMAVLVEGISVIVRRDALERKLKGGWPAFVSTVPNGTLCADDYIARIGFMDPSDVKQFVDGLERCGLTFQTKGKAMDIAIVDQLRGLTIECEWLEFSRFSFGDSGGKVSVAWLFEGKRIAAGVHFPGESLQFATPDGWTYEGSLSERFTFVEVGTEGERLKFLRSENGVDVFLDLATGQEVFRGRAS